MRKLACILLMFYYKMNGNSSRIWIIILIYATWKVLEQPTFRHNLSWYLKGQFTKSQEDMLNFSKSYQNCTHHQIFSVFGIFSAQIFDIHPDFFHFWIFSCQILRHPPNFFLPIWLFTIKFLALRPIFFTNLRSRYLTLSKSKFYPTFFHISLLNLLVTLNVVPV